LIKKLTGEILVYPPPPPVSFGDTVPNPPPPPLGCHILFEWLLMTYALCIDFFYFLKPIKK
jgi:hypothetical protein